MEISILVAVAENGVIGKDNKLLWKLSDDLKLFKNRTLGHVVIMGRKTYDSIGKPLPQRINIVISRNPHLHLPGCIVETSIEEAIEKAKQLTDKEEIFIIGGQKIYELAEKLATKIYLTKVNAALEGDAFFDLTPYAFWTQKSQIFFEQSTKNEFDFEVTELQKPDSGQH